MASNTSNSAKTGINCSIYAAIKELEIDSAITFNITTITDGRRVLRNRP